MDTSQVGNLARLADLHDVPQADTKVLPYSFVHSDFSLLQLVVHQSHHYGFFSLFALYEDSISLENLELGHFAL